MKKRILIVDDEPDINLLFKMILEENSEFIVHSFTDPLLALKNFKPNLYDLILVDIKMPEMTGYEVTEVLQSEFPLVATRKNMFGFTSFESGSEEVSQMEKVTSKVVQKPAII